MERKSETVGLLVQVSGREVRRERRLVAAREGLQGARLYLVGGQDSQDNSLSLVERLREDGKGWEAVAPATCFESCRRPPKSW